MVSGAVSAQNFRVKEIAYNESLPPEVLSMPWKALGEPVKYDIGEVLFYAGHSPRGVYRLVKGTVELKNRRTKMTAGPGALLGLPFCLKQLPHAYTATSLTPVTVRFIPFWEVVAMLGGAHPLQLTKPVRPARAAAGRPAAAR
jgi:CRP-like cAMP-binding protein